MYLLFYCFKQKTAYEVRISDWSSDVCSSDLITLRATPKPFNDPENLVDSAVRSMLDHPIHAINQRETMVSQATDVLKHEHDAILMAIKILDQISDEARQGNATSTDVTQFLGFMREFADQFTPRKNETHG